MLGRAVFGFGFCWDGLVVGWVWVMCEMFGISKGMDWLRGVGGLLALYTYYEIDA